MKENSREYQKAVDYICSEIANGNISIGDRLPTERTLSGQLGISRNSTREALRSLEYGYHRKCERFRQLLYR